MKILKLLPLVILLTGCSTLDSIFPDRKKEYKETKTIPPLEIPPDLSTSSIENRLPIPGEEDFVTSGGKDKGAQRLDVQKTETRAYSKLVSGADALPAIRINDSFPSAWRSTGKALANLRIEIGDRNRALGTYYIRYAKAVTEDEGGFFSSLAFWRDEVEPEEQEFRIFLKQAATVTELKVLNDQGEPATGEVARELLKKLQEQFKSF